MSHVDSHLIVIFMTQVRSHCIDEMFPDISKLQAKLIAFSVFNAFYTLAINVIVGIYKSVCSTMCDLFEGSNFVLYFNTGSVVHEEESKFLSQI